MVNEETMGCADEPMTAEDIAEQEAIEADWAARDLAEREFMKRGAALQAAIQVASMGNHREASAEEVLEDATLILEFLSPSAPVAH